MGETIALIVAAGRGERVGGPIPKQYRKLAGKPVLRWTVETFANCLGVDGVRVVIRSEDEPFYKAAVAGLPFRSAIAGGTTRQDSVRRGLEALVSREPERVLIHDAARPFVSAKLVTRVLAGLDNADAAAPMLPVADTLRRRSGSGYEIVARDNLWRAQTPQGFRFDKILSAHRTFAGAEVTDDIALAERAGLSIAPVAGEEMNFKLTTEEDFMLAERLAGSGLSDVRTGTGYDVHKFVPGDHVWLCGVKLRHDFGLEGHSDADVGLHALTDAILGAVGAGDIGVHFPPTDERWRGAPSHRFLEHASRLVREIGGVISHVDVTLICERPKITPHRQNMRARIAEILDIDIVRVSVKATTTEGLGFTGRREGLAAQAVATIRLPSP